MVSPRLSPEMGFLTITILWFSIPVLMNMCFPFSVQGNMDLSLTTAWFQYPLQMNMDLFLR